MLRQALEQKQIQKLSPQQIMTAKLIELPIQRLEQRVRQEMEENPVLERPEKELKAFAKVSLAPGESKTVKFEIPASELAYFNPDSHSWVLDPDHEFKVYFAAASDDVRGSLPFRTR